MYIEILENILFKNTLISIKVKLGKVQQLYTFSSIKETKHITYHLKLPQYLNSHCHSC